MDYYKLLGVARTASQEEIQKAYHELALKYHPDVNPGDTQAAEKFKEINKAYGVLSKPDKRKEYDLGSKGSRPMTQPPTGTRPTPGKVSRPNPTGRPLQDLLGDMWGTAQQNAANQSAASDETGGKRSGPPMVEIKLTTREALAGAIKTIRVNGKPLRIKISIIR